MQDPFSLDAEPARVLVRLPAEASLTGAKGRLAVGGKTVELVPLCPNEAASRKVGLAPAQRWYAAQLDTSAGSPDQLWALAHEALRSSQLAAAGPAAFAEPDMPQTWLYGRARGSLRWTNLRSLRAARQHMGGAP